MLLLASISGTFTEWIAHNGVYAVFGLMALDALLPAGGELIMLYAGVLAAGAIAGHEASLLGVPLASGLESYLALALAGSLGYLLGAVIGWAIGHHGGRRLVESHGRWPHVSPEALARAERWFDRYGPRAVLLGRVTPVVRSFISIPAGVLGSPLRTYVPLTLLGSALWCFSFAAAGWALGGSWNSFHERFGYVDYAVVAAAALFVAMLVLRRRSARRSPLRPSRLAEERAD